MNHQLRSFLRFMAFLWLLALVSFVCTMAHGQTVYPLLHWKEPVANQAALPSVGNVPGDARVDTTTFSIWIWNGSAWTQNAGTGTVTTVTGTPPIVITGTPTVNPNVTITQAATAASGYLSAADWNTFNNKQAALTIGNLTDAGTDGLTVTNGTGAVIGSGTSLSQHVADASHNGYLSSSDWSAFNAKQAALTFGNLTDAGTDGITVTNGTGAVIGSGTSVAQHVADTTHNGYLLSADWNTFNGKQAAGSYITALTGDVSASGPGSVSATLATVNGSPGTCTNATVTVNGKGLTTSCTSGTSPAGGLTNTSVSTGATRTPVQNGVSGLIVTSGGTTQTLSDCTSTGPWTYHITNQNGGITTVAASGSNTFNDSVVSGSASYQLTDPGADAWFECTTGNSINVAQ